VSRVGTVERKTKETSVSVTVDLDGSGRVSVNTGIAFFDHMSQYRHRVFRSHA